MCIPEKRDVLVKLGMALYLHRKLAETARKGFESVRYLEQNGVFAGMDKVSRPRRVPQ